MSAKYCRTPASIAVLTLAEIKAATQSFDSGQTNLADALDAIIVAIEAYRRATNVRSDAA